MAGLSVSKRRAEEAYDARIEELKSGPVPSYFELAEAIAEADKAIRVAEIIASRRGHDAKIGRDLRRKVRKVIATAAAESVVYVVKRPRERMVKIGFSTNLASRMATLQTAAGAQLVLLAAAAGTREDEKALHKRFAEHRASGEWFRYHREIERWVAEVKITKRLGTV